jgi:multiple sugar transport system ATP-binding protein
MNLFEATLSEDGETLRVGSQSLALGRRVHEACPDLVRYRGRQVIVGFRAEDLPVATGDASDGPVMKARVEEVEALGSELLVHFSIDATRIGGDARAASVGEELDLAAIDIVGEGVARVEPRATLQVGGDVLFQVFPERMHFFDPESQNAI